jgi:hypothetical protein
LAWSRRSTGSRSSRRCAELNSRRACAGKRRSRWNHLGCRMRGACFRSIAPERFDTRALDDVLEQMGGVPLAIELLAHAAEGEATPEGLAVRWHSERARLLQRATADHRLLSIAVSIDTSWSSPLMTDPARQLVSVLSWLPDGVAARILRPYSAAGRRPQASCDAVALSSIRRRVCARYPRCATTSRMSTRQPSRTGSVPSATTTTRHAQPTNRRLGSVWPLPSRTPSDRLAGDWRASRPVATAATTSRGLDAPG